MRTIVIIAAGAAAVIAASASAETRTLSEDARVCPSWAEAHERTLASLNNGRPPYPVKWKGCVRLKKGAQVELIDHDQWSTEIVADGKHWFADEDLF
ncbi:MAG: hypothetical protein ACLPPF_10365 [Rhodomicrobium sp.]